ncbi:MAG: aminopeptidase, partial [Candidatus Nanohalobium sp.]
WRLMEYEEPESHGSEPPENVAEAMKTVDVVIAPTNKSISHTKAREEACEVGTVVASMPLVNKEIWKTSLQTDYSRVKKITEKAYALIEDTSRIRVETPSGTELEFEVDLRTYDQDTGIIGSKGELGNLPAGETDGFPVGINGELVIDHLPFAPEGTKVEIKDGEVTAIKHPEGVNSSELAEAFDEKPCSRRIAEFGFGTNPEATLIGVPIQDEKVLGTVHFAFGDNTFYVGEERANPCGIHWDSVCESPTVWFDDEKVLDEGEPVFLDR